ncbi:MAG: A24 family peptidase [Eubacterium sp.]|nr:A24 family peptidase [Eubacterium sp.]
MLLLSGAVITDLKAERIDHAIILGGLCCGFVYQYSLYGGLGILYFLGNILVPIILLFPLFIMRALGAGDLKLFAVVGAFVGFTGLIHCMMVSFVLAAVFCCWKLIKNKNGWTRIAYFFEYLRGAVLSKSIPVYDRGGRENLIHFSVFILFGYVICQEVGM